MRDALAREEPIYRLWISRHHWALMQRGAVPATLEKHLEGGQRLVVQLSSGGDGLPAVQTAALEQRRRLRGYRALATLPREQVVVHIEES